MPVIPVLIDLKTLKLYIYLLKGNKSSPCYLPDRMSERGAHEKEGPVSTLFIRVRASIFIGKRSHLFPELKKRLWKDFLISYRAFPASGDYLKAS